MTKLKWKLFTKVIKMPTGEAWVWIGSVLIKREVQVLLI
jgi:hypothetical protein